MKRLIILLFVLIAILPMHLLSQNIEFKKKNFPEREEAFKEAIVVYEEGIRLMQENNIDYNKTLPLLNQANDFNPSNSDLNLKLAICYYFTHEYPLAIKHSFIYEKLSEEINPESLKIRAKSYFHLHQFEQGIHVLDSCLTYYEKDTEEKNRLKLWSTQAKNGLYLQAPEERLFIENIGDNINSQASESSFAYDSNSETIYFITNYYDGIFHNENQIFSAQKIKDTIWTKPELLSFDTDLNNTRLLGYSPLGSLVISNGKKETVSAYKLADNLWIEEEKFSKDINQGSIHSVCYSKTGDTLFFSSIRKGGFGGYDIYYSLRRDDKWGEVYNMGEPYNTIGDELNISIYNNQLVFSSNGPASYGGYDIFKAEINLRGYAEIEHLHYPLNSTHQEYGLFIYDHGEKAILSSDRPKSKGSSDLFAVQFMGPPKELAYLIFEPQNSFEPKKILDQLRFPQKAEIKKEQYLEWNAQLKDSLSDKTLKGIIQIVDYETNQQISRDSLILEYFDILFPFGKRYLVSFESVGYLPVNRLIDLRNNRSYLQMNGNVGLSKTQRKSTSFIHISHDLDGDHFIPQSLLSEIENNPVRRFELNYRFHVVRSQTNTNAYMEKMKNWLEQKQISNCVLSTVFIQNEEAEGILIRVVR